jgi:hypothetical protein
MLGGQITVLLDAVDAQCVEDLSAWFTLWLKVEYGNDGIALY